MVKPTSILPEPPKSLRIRFSGPGINPFDFLKRRRRELDLLLKGESGIFWFGYGRNAVEYALFLLELESGTEILFPYYSCNVLLPLFYRYGVRARFYSVNNQLRPDFEEMRSLLSSQTRLLLVVNYFGFPQDYKVIRDFCAEHRLLFLEDNAGGFGGRFEGKLMGSFGDVSITCTRKTLPAIDGAYLAVNNKGLLKKACLKSNLRLVKEERRFYRLAASFYRYLANRVAFLGRRQDYISPEYYLLEDELKHYDYTPYRLSSISRYLASRLRLSKIMERRRELYKAWLDWLQQFSDITPIFPELREGVNPQVVPVYTVRRDEWLKWGIQHGIDVCSWPSLSREQQTEATLHLWKNTCCFPIS